jgi:hypothetical protein
MSNMYVYAGTRLDARNMVRKRVMCTPSLSLSDVGKPVRAWTVRG